MPRIAQDREHRPSPELIAGLAERVVTGVIRLPKFQREFVWSRQQVLDLMDSISRNYPIGSLLLWKSPLNLASDSPIAGLRIQPRENDEQAAYLLDGCQRLSAICGAFYWEGDDPGSYWNLVYDLQQEQFLYRTDLEEPPPHQVPLRLIPDPAAFFTRTRELAPELQDRAGTLFNRFTQYEVAVVTMQGTSLSEIGRIFERVNTRGTPLTTMEIVRAATWTSDFDVFAEIDRVRGALEAKHYGKIDRNLLLRAVTASSGLGFSKADIEGLVNIELGDFRLAIDQTEAAARRAVDFLSIEIGTPTADALPYLNQLAVVIEIFRQVPRPDARQFREIRRWFWSTALSGYYDGWNVRKMKADRDAITAFANGAKTIDVAVSPLNSRLWLTGQYLRGSARTKALALLLAAAGPRDLRTGARIDAGRALALANDMQYHHFFPKAWLMRRDTSYEDANVFANVVMLTAISNQAIGDQAPSAYLKDEIDFSGEEEIVRRLDSLLVSRQAFEAAMRDDYQAFVAARASTLLDWALDLTRGERAAGDTGTDDPEVVRHGMTVEVTDRDTDD